MFWRILVTTTAVIAWLAAFNLASAAPPVDFDTSGLPKPPTNFEEQKLWDSIETARRYPELASETHKKLADYYERRGLLALAAKERAAAGGAVSTAQGGNHSQQPVPPPGQPSAQGDALDPAVFDLSAFPSKPTNFEEQLIQDSLQDPNTMTTPVLMAFAHRQLGRYYAARGRADLAAGEYARAVVAVPEDHRGYAGLAALSEGMGVEATDGAVALRDVADQLLAQGYSPEGPDEAEPVVTPDPNPGQWQEVSAEFNRRMNYLYNSNAWSNINRTVFNRLY
ncbi:MAG: hypothetical protein M1531_03955 [Chloroflexi bacterium]|nr:hypothetical protein [Chloroflexota bacterium]